MCCMLTSLIFFGPRLAILIWWLISPVYVGAAFNSVLLSLLAWAFIPWTVLMYLFIYPNGVVGFDWVILILGILADVASYSGGFWGNRNQIPGYAE
ncbi:MAG: hypothetical protein MUO67_18040 [Anaerolineales bacterium]|nr:hypothetical protein [Anaerolineales bacterium]